MPRDARWVLPGIPLHIVQRGIDRRPCFFTDSDYRTYLRFLASSAQRFACSVHAYCLMTNHVHLLVTPHDADACGAFMKYLGQCYVQSVNQRLARTGTLWEGRFRSCVVQSESYVLACYRYIELNPVRASMVSSPADYPWSSHGANAAGKPCKVVRPHAVYESLGLDTPSRADAYRMLCADALPPPQIDEIRKATRVGCAIGARRRGRGRPSLAK